MDVKRWAIQRSRGMYRRGKGEHPLENGRFSVFRSRQTLLEHCIRLLGWVIRGKTFVAGSRGSRWGDFDCLDNEWDRAPHAEIPMSCSSGTERGALVSAGPIKLNEQVCKALAVTSRSQTKLQGPQPIARESCVRHLAVLDH